MVFGISGLGLRISIKRSNSEQTDQHEQQVQTLTPPRPIATPLLNRNPDFKFETPLLEQLEYRMWESGLGISMK